MVAGDGPLRPRLERRAARDGLPVSFTGFEPPPTRWAEFGWMATKGTAWLFRRSRDMVPALAGLAVREWLGPERDVAAESAPT